MKGKKMRKKENEKYGRKGNNREEENKGNIY